MKKTLIALATLTAIAGAAQAQSTVTLYGVADVYAGQKSTTINGTKLKQTVIDSGGLNTSRFGLRGTEDLGSGLKAIFTMEAGIALDKGEANLNGGGLFSRQAFVGLSGNFGTVTLGRQYTAYDGLRSATNHSYDSTLFGNATTADVFNNGVADYQLRTSNSFAYASPVYNGFSGAFVLSGGEDKANGTATSVGVKASRNNSFHIKYANGPVLVGYAYQNEKFNAGSTIASLPTAQFPNGNTQTGDRTYNLFAGSYDFGVAKITGGYNIAKQERSTPSTSNGKDKEFQFGVSAPFGAATVAAGYVRSKSDNSDRRSTGYSLLGTYDLSKRTRLYAGGISEKFSGSTGFSAATTGTNAGLTRRQAIVAGVRHAF